MNKYVEQKNLADGVISHECEKRRESGADWVQSEN